MKKAVKIWLAALASAACFSASAQESIVYIDFIHGNGSVVAADKAEDNSAAMMVTVKDDKTGELLMADAVSKLVRVGDRVTYRKIAPERCTIVRVIRTGNHGGSAKGRR